MYDIIFFGDNDDHWRSWKETFPSAKKATDFKTARRMAFTKMFWMVDGPLPDHELDINVPTWAQDRVYEIGNSYLVSKKATDLLSARLVDTTKKNWFPYDVVFISYDEKNADDNYRRLLEIYPYAYRVNKVKGIHNAHVAAARLATSPMVWIIDGDAIVVNDFDFTWAVKDDYSSIKDLETVHVWRSKNPVNDLSYGYGGIKLFPRELTLNMDTTTTDMTTSISKSFRIHEDIANITDFNTDPFSAWKSGFRECVKLSSRLIDRQDDQETEERLQVWQTKGADRPFGTYTIDGARCGAKYGRENAGNADALRMINDFVWLRERFNERYDRNT